MVNVSDINQFEKERKLVNKNVLQQIFDKQKELLIKYRDIEKIPHVLNINSAEHQKLLKEFTFRGIEELAEAYEATEEHNIEHFIEEISDAIHFFTEVMIMAQIEPEKLTNIDDYTSHELALANLEPKLWIVSYHFSIACNVLKSKPWKVSQVITDIDKYKKRMITAYNQFMWILNLIGFGSEDILRIYLNKNSVNNFRIRSRY
jgi:dimeric dUTPase (all-alpha-NTP-PPase superfamily)